MENLCPCGNEQAYEDCCRPVISGEKQAETAEALMRARYSAHVKTEVDFIYETTHPDKRSDVEKRKVASWSRKSDWLGLQITATQDGGLEDDKGVVEFTARYREKGKIYVHREIAHFVRQDNRWYFLDGESPKQVQSVRQGPKIGRNDPCPCGSGKKFKKCCHSVRK